MTAPLLRTVGTIAACVDCGADTVADRRWRALDPRLRKQLAAAGFARRSTGGRCNRCDLRLAVARREERERASLAAANPAGFADPRLPLRFWRKIEVDAAGCWEWMACRNDDGYGVYRHEGVTDAAHRVAFTALRYPVAEGLELDHLCRNRACCNPDHLEPVTHAENVARSLRSPLTQCRNGHPYSDENTLVNHLGHRSCRTCRRAAGRRYDERQRNV